MKNLNLEPEQVLYTEDTCDPATIAGAFEIYCGLREGSQIKKPIYVIKFAEFPGRYTLLSGNRRTKAAEWCGIRVPALEIENQRDFQLAQMDQPTNWHRLEEEDFLRFGDGYFYKDVAVLRQRGLLMSAYHRARKRIREAVKRFYHWL